METIAPSVAEPEAQIQKPRHWLHTNIGLPFAILVIVALLFVLAGIFQSGQTQGKRYSNYQATVRNAYQIHQGLVAYAQSHDQKFPEGKTANEAYRQLFVADLVDDEKVFHVAGSAWSWRKPDNNTGTKENGFADALMPGENHLSYVRELTVDKHDSTLPVVADGFAHGRPSQYSADPKEKGGLWKGKYGIVVRIGGNAKLCDLNSEFRVIEKKDGKDMDIFSAEYGTNPENILNPE